MFDTAGSRLNFPVVAGVAETFRISFMTGGQAMSVLGATFAAGCYEAHGDARGELVAELPVQHDARDNAVLLSVPALDEGHYWWELRATDAAGDESRLLYGTLAALTSADFARLGDEADEAEMRELVVQVGTGYAEPLVLRWQACSLAGSLATDAARHAERAEAAAGRAEAAQEDVLGKLAAAAAFMESFDRALFEAIRVVDGFLWVGGVNTGHYLKGADGVAPHIGADGYWHVGQTRLGDRPAFGKDGITPHITPDGFWAFGEHKTAVRAAGRDGIDGSAVRRILAGSYEDIPQEGELCHGGVLFYVPAGVARRERMACSVSSGAALGNFTLTGPMVFSAGRSWTRRGGELLRFGLMAGGLSGGEPSEEELYAHVFYEAVGAWAYAGRSVAAVAQRANEVSWWEFEGMSPALAECRVKVVLSRVAEQPTDAQAERIRVRVEEVDETEGSKMGASSHCAWAYWAYRTQELQEYDVYAWVERPAEGGAGAWVRVDEDYDLATADVYGLMKYATDRPVAGGAPVGRNLDGQACVPVADAAMPGAVLPSSAARLSEGGLTHVGEDRRLYVGMATPSVPGVGKTSYARALGENTNTVGLTADGKFAVPRAAAFQWGVSKVGTSVPQSNGMPWIIPVGAAEDGVRNEYGQDITGQLMNNVLVGGALRTALKETWRGWAPKGIDAEVLPDASNAVGLMTSGSFRQTAAQGLELEEATEELLGGVRLADSVTESGAGVVTAGVLHGHLGEHYYTRGETVARPEVFLKGETYSREAVDGKFEEFRREELGEFETVEHAAGVEAELRAELARRLPSNVMGLAEYAALPKVERGVLYILTED